MEEIFKQVLENASRALMENSTEKSLKSCIGTSPPCVPEEFHVQKATLNGPQLQKPGRCHTDDKSLATLPGCEQLMQPYVVRYLLHSLISWLISKPSFMFLSGRFLGIYLFMALRLYNTSSTHPLSPCRQL